MRTRRNLLIVLGAAPFAPRSVFAQAKKPPVLIGWRSFGSGRGGVTIAAFRERLAALGWKEGSQFVIEARWGDSQDDRLASFAEELAAKKPALIVASSMRAAAAVAKVAPKIPIVMVANNDPVAAGLVTSLARPGGMITGLGGFGADLSGKHLELLLAAAPQVRRVGYLVPSTGTNRTELLEMAQRAAKQYRVDARIVNVAGPEEIEPALSRLATEGIQGLVMLPFALFGSQQGRILTFSLAQRWPVVATAGSWAVNGALLAYGPDQLALHRRAAWYVDRILKGAKPGDLPIEQPTTFELVVNMKTAKALGLTMPPEIMVRVTQVIE
jgi:putative ABC transport system substrate-binding protein